MRKILAIAFVGVAVLTSAASAGRFNKVLSIGDGAPSWPRSWGPTTSCTVSTSTRTPRRSSSCSPAIIARSPSNTSSGWWICRRDYKDKGVQVVAICVNGGEEDNLGHMKARAEERAFNFPYLSDPTQATGKLFGAQKTPEAFVLDAKRKVVYMGAIDDSWMSAEDVKKPYVRSAPRGRAIGQES